MAGLEASLELLSNDGATLSLRATVVKGHHVPVLGIKVFAAGIAGFQDNFTYNAGLQLFAQGDTVDFKAPCPPTATTENPTAFVWAFPDSVTPVSNVIDL